jgi:pyruvate/2-oxoacid:ferredoxin oxidoreductase alpha subunit
MKRQSDIMQVSQATASLVETVSSLVEQMEEALRLSEDATIPVPVMLDAMRVLLAIFQDMQGLFERIEQTNVGGGNATTH